MRNFDEASITVSIHPPGFGQARAVTVPIDLYEARKVFRSIDFPSADAGMAAIFCTPDATQKLKDRKTVVDLIANVVARELMKMIGDGDTEMGYPKRK